MIDWSPATPFAIRVRDAARRTDGWFVGGAVRDLFLRVPFGDVDLLSPDHAEDLATQLASDLGGSLRSYPQFFAFKVVVSREAPVDVVRARRETYPRAGSLPSVEPGSIEEDLFRRDFTVNAVAVRCCDERILDPQGGLADLGHRALRVMHTRSFVDDPTRILRGVRLAARLGLELEPATAALAEQALRGGAMMTVSRERLWREVLLASRESDPASTFLALADSRAIERLTGLKASTELLRSTLPRLATFLAENETIDRDVAFVGAMLRGNDRAEELLSGAGFSAARRSRVIEIASMPPGLPRRSSSSRFSGFRSRSRESLAVLRAEDPDAAHAVDEFFGLLRVNLPFRGNQLGVPPGPHIALAMERTREALFSGETSQREARAFARAKALQYLSDQSR